MLHHLIDSGLFAGTLYLAGIILAGLTIRKDLRRARVGKAAVWFRQ